MLLIHFLVVEPILLTLDFDFDLDFDQLGNLNIDEPLFAPLVELLADPLDFDFVVDAPKKELVRVSDSVDSFVDEPNGHHDEDLDS